MKTTNLILSSLIILFISCDKEKRDIRNSTDNLSITYGNVCGWCGFDSLTVTQDMTTISGMNYCNNTEFHDSMATPESTWSGLKSTVDLQQFKAIDLYTCYVCVDGCDTWITIKSDTYFHKIRYGFDDLDKLKSIQALIDQLNEIHQSF